jgi:hypothetical protein
MPSFYFVGVGLLIIVVIAVFFTNLENYRQRKSNTSYEELIEKHELISEEWIYKFMNNTFFNSDTILNDSLCFFKVNILTSKHSSDLRKYISSSSLLSRADKKYLKSQLSNKIFIWDKNRLVNVWCLTPRDFFAINEIVSEKADTTDVAYAINAYSYVFEEIHGVGGQHRYSKPIFNRDKSFAVIEYQYYYSAFAAGSDILLYEKKGDKWILIDEKNLWIS